MIIEYVLFSIFFVLTLVGWLNKLARRNTVISKQEEIEDVENQKSHIKSAIRMMFTTVPYFGAYYYADFSYLWLTLGIAYLVIGILVLIVSSISLTYKIRSSKEYEKQRAIASEQNINREFWPKWQEHGLCVFGVVILVFWVYSWRHLFA